MLTIQTGTVSRCHKYLDKMGNINQQSVQKLPSEVKEFLREITPKRLKELAQMNCFAAEKIKTELDKQYGESNYVLIAIGRSLSSIAETLGKMGVDTKIIPLSGLRQNDVEYIPKDDLHAYKSFLVQIGLSKTDLKNNKEKTYILTDYTFYGRSLTRAEKLLRKDELLGDAPNLITMPVSEFLKDNYSNKGFNQLFSYSRFEDYSYVGKLHINNLKNVYKQCMPERIGKFKGNITQGLRKLFWFNVFDSLKEQNYKNIIPIKELDAINKHYLSIKAIRNYIKREQKKLEQL